MTVAKFTGWKATGLPLVNYAVEYEARRVEGADFFAALTLPVGSLDRCISFINGGWGGMTTGLSNIDDMTAKENATTSSQTYELGKWYAFRIEVRKDGIQVWMDGRKIINAATEGYRIGLRPGDIELCAPFGLASWETKGEVRRLEVMPLE
jgi:hypothetical protein